MLDRVKVALRVAPDTYEFDDEILSLIEAAKQDLGIAGVVIPECMTEVVQLAVTTFCRLHFGAPEESDKLKASYDEQKAQLMTATGYTVWTEAM